MAREVNDVRTQIHQRTAAALCVSQAPTHRAIWILIATVQVIEMKMVDGAEPSIGDHLVRKHQCRYKTIVEYHPQPRLAGSGCLGNFLRLNAVAREWLVHDHMFARAQRGEND